MVLVHRTAFLEEKRRRNLEVEWIQEGEPPSDDEGLSCPAIALSVLWAWLHQWAGLHQWGEEEEELRLAVLGEGTLQCW